MHKPLDPRAERILELADERGVSGAHVALARQFREAAAAAWGRPLTMNVADADRRRACSISGFPPATVKAVPILARTASLLAHLAEEQEHPIGFLMAARRRGGDRVHDATWDEQLALDAASFAEQIAYLLEHSPFYRAKLPFKYAHEAAGWTRSPSCRSPRSSELRASVTRENPIGTHLCVGHAGGRAHLLDQRHHRDAELHPADRARPRELGHRLGAQLRAPPGSQAGQRIVTTYNAGPFVAGAALASFDRLGLTHIPVGTGNTERLMRAIDRFAPEAVALTPSYAAYLVEWAPTAASTCAARASSACWWPASPAAASRRSAPSWRRAGARR